ncbi:oxygenase MpaB family protein [Rhodococcus sp. B50]|uniref:oxygenase MpaB family protein n=1 Tax=Rhodococcus sp. B50 TaxID=2682847 RepID=UPI001BD646D8|nr:oxygenase MpaB family protein [Rhodococcus sp. B50]MBS9375352.1 hypothetical protein [Rhodococcus sp. B50]
MTTTVDKPAGLDDTMDGLGLAAGAANIIMQLSWPGVGYGVYESRVESGRLFDHPIKRTRTTLTYLAVAARGTDDEKRLFRRGVNKAHAQVRSTESSPVEYNAMDPELQLWVASCIYRGFEDVHRALYGPIPDDAIEYFYQNGATFGTTLQVPQHMWPKDRAAFEQYWEDNLHKVKIDDTIREHLLSIARIEFLPQPVPALFGKLNLFFTAGFLPPLFREQMLLPWTPRDQRRFDRVMRALGAVNKRLPVAVRELPYRVLLADMRRRIRTGRSLV